jgi:subtilisin-like proprotein convertase family protein
MRAIIILIFLTICVSSYAQMETAKRWTKTFNSGYRDVALKTLVDNEGNLIVAGYRSVTGTANDSTARMLVMKYNPLGEEVWSKIFHSRSGRRTVVKGLDVDDSGNVYISGIADTSVYDMTRGLVVKYSPVGDTLWSRYYGFPSFPWLYHDVKVNMDGEVFVACELYVPPPLPGNGRSCSIVKYNSSGVFQWISFGIINTTNPILKINTFGSVFLGGTTTGVSGGDIRIVNVDNTGTQQWSIIYNSPSGGTDSITGLSSDPVTGDLVAVGWSVFGSNGTREVQTLKFSSGLGQLMWAKRTNGSTVGGYNSINDFDISPTGDIYIGGQFTNNTTGIDGYLIRYNTGGNELYRKIYSFNGGNTNEGITTLDVGATNEPLVSGYRASLSNTFIYKYSTSGGITWKYNYSDSTNTFDEGPAKIIMGQGNKIYNVVNYFTASLNDINVSMWDNIPVNNVSICRNFNTPTIAGDYIYDTVTVNTGMNKLARIEVKIDSLVHADPKDLVIKLKSPDGIMIDVFKNSGLTLPSTGMYGTVLTDTASKTIDSGSATYTGYFTPFQSLEVHNSYVPDGDWVLMVYNIANGDTGIVKKWCLNIIYEAPVGIQTIGSEIPKSFSLSQNYPNPFNPVTNIKFSMPKSGNITLKVYDILGREVAELVNEFKPAGNYLVDFNASHLSSDIYFYRIYTSEFTEVKKMVLVK